MKKKLAVLLALIVVLLAAAYLGVSYKLYHQLSTVKHNPRMLISHHASRGSRNARCLECSRASPAS